MLNGVYLLGRYVALLFIIFVLSGSAFAKELKRDPDTGVIRVIYIGMPSAASPYQVFKYDPLLSTLPIQGNMYGIASENVKRSMRIYMPRTKGHLVEDFDIIGLDDTTYDAFPLQTIQWMVDGCRDDALGLFMAGGFESFGGGGGYSSWENTVIREVFPVVSTGEYGPDGRVDVVEWDDELVKSVPWDRFNEHNIFGGYNVVLTKEGANEIARITRQTASGLTDPAWVWWDIGKGRFFASAPGFRGGSANKGFIRWKHYPDFVTNMVYFLAGLTPPSDATLLHTTRATFGDIQDRRQTIAGVVDFISRFGADSRRVDEKLKEAEDLRKAAREKFVDLELEESKQIADQVMEVLQEAYDLAFEARDTALFWIFMTEWLVVSGTGLVVGAVLWTLMVKRRLYREVQITREAR